MTFFVCHPERSEGAVDIISVILYNFTVPVFIGKILSLRRTQTNVKNEEDKEPLYWP